MPDDHRRIDYDPSRPGGMWHVWTTDGTQYDYISELSGGRPTVWRLRLVTDTSGNQVRYAYRYDQSAPSISSSVNAYLDSISYGDVRISFYWEDRPDTVTQAAPDPNAAQPPPNYAGPPGVVLAMRWRLKTISVTANGHEVRAYGFCYGACQPTSPAATVSTGGPSTPSLLSQVQLYGNDVAVDPAGNITGSGGGGAPPPVHVLPTKLAYSAAGGGWSAPSVEETGGSPSYGRGSEPVYAFPRVQVPAPGDNTRSRFTFGDFNGDGRTDYAYVSQPGGDLVPGQTQLYFETQLARSPVDDTGLGPISTQLIYQGPANAQIQGLMAADLNGDGRSDLVISVQVDNTNDNDSFWKTIYLIPAYSTSRPGFYILGPPLGSDTSNRDGTGIETSELTITPPCQVGDVNGDGLQDVVCLDADFAHWDNDPTKGGPPDFKLVTFMSSNYVSSSGQTSQEVDQAIALNDPTGNFFMTMGSVDGSGLQSPIIVDVDAPAVKPGVIPHAVIVTARSLGNGYYDVSRSSTSWPVDGSTRVMAGDITGNGLDDLVVIQTHSRGNDQGGVSIETALRQADGSYVLNSQPVTPSLSADGYEVTLGDATGDGRADLLFATPRNQGEGVHCDQSGQSGAPPTTMATVVPSKGDGQFTFPQRWDDCAYSHDLRVPWARGDTWDATAANNITAAADTSGSGLADVLYVSWPPYPSGTYTTLVDDPSVDQGTDSRRFLAVSLRSPGESDLVYPRDTGDGTVLHTYLRNRDGTYTHLDDQFFSRPGGRPSPAGWHALDLLGNGRTDLVYISNRMDLYGAASNLIIDTFLANGDGTWTELPIQSQAITGMGFEPGRWRIVDLGPGPQPPITVGKPAPAQGDRFGLVYLGTQIYTLIFDPATNTWNPATGPDTNNNPNAAGCPADNADWLVADVNGDGRSDLILLCEDPFAETVRLVTWLATGPGAWEAAPQDYRTSSSDWPGSIEPANLAGWRVLDSNGDRMADLAYLQSAPGGLYLDGLLSTGNGGWIAQKQPPPQPPSFPIVTPGPLDPDPNDAARWQDLSRWQVAPPVPGDPRAGLLHVTQSTGGIRVDTIRRSSDAASWSVSLGTPQPAVPADAVPAGTPWLDFAIGTNGAADLVHVAISGPNMVVQPLVDNSSPELLTRITNPLGGSVSLTYATSATWPAGSADDGCYLPPGAAIWTLSTATISDGLSPPATTALRFAYNCPQWWGQQRTVAGWRDTAATRAASAAQAAATTIAHYAVSGTGQHKVQAIATTTAETVSADDLPSDPGALLTRTTFDYAPTGDESLNSLTTTSCEQSFCQQAYSLFIYDDFGNLRQVQQTGDQPPEYWSTRDLDRRVFFDPVPPVTSRYQYQVSLLADTRLYGPSPISGPPLQETRYCYGLDGSCDSVAPQGLVTNVLQLDEQDGNTWLSTRYHYDGFGNLNHITDPNGHGTTIQYDQAPYVYPTLIRNDDLPQLTESESWDQGLGVLLSQTDANHATTTYGYDPLGRLTSTTYPNNGTESINYDALMRPDPAQHDIAVTIPTGQPGGLWAREYLDGTGRPVKDEQPRPQGNGHVTATTYAYADATGQPWRISNPYDEQTGQPIYTTFGYDSLGRPIAETFPSGDQQTWAYSGGQGYLSVTAQHDRQTEQTNYDAWGSPISAVANHNGQPLTTTYQVNPADELTAITDPQGNTEQRTYDSLGRLRVDTDPDRGPSTYAYDNNGNLTSTTDARGIQTNYTYDVAGRLKTRSHPDDPSQTVTLTYDGPQPDSIGRLTQIQDPSAAGCPGGISDTFGYDNMGHVTHWAKCILGQQLAFSAAYDSVGTGLLSELRYPSSPHIAGNSPLTFSYNAAGVPDALKPIISNIQYTPSQQQQDIFYSNHVHEHFNYDDLNRFTGDTVSDGTRTILTDVIVPNPDGTIGAYTHTISTAAAPMLQSFAGTTSETSTVTRDDIGRLAAISGANARQYTYNDSGSIATSSLLGTYSYPPQGPDGCGPQTPCPSPHAATQAGTHTYSYDANGNMMMRDGQPLIWNDNNQLEWIRHPDGTWTHQIFDATGSLVYSNDQSEGPRGQPDLAAGGTRIYGSFETVFQPSKTTKQATQYLYLGPSLAGIRDAHGNHTVITDYQGSPELILGPTGRIEATPQYGAYGDTIKPGLSSTGPGYLGAWSNSTTGLLLLGSRFYDPRLGQFISPDSKLDPTTEPGSTNRYSYSLDDPLTFQDPTGYDPLDTDTADVTSDTSGGLNGGGVTWPYGGEVSWPPEQGTQQAAAGPIGSTQSSLQDNALSFVGGFAQGAAIGIGTTYAIGFLSGLFPPLGLAVGAGLLAYGAYSLATGGAQALWNSGSRIVNGTASSADYATIGAFAAGIATGALGKSMFSAGQGLGNSVRSAAGGVRNVMFSTGSVASNAEIVESGAGLSRNLETVSDVAGRAGVDLRGSMVRIIEDPEYIRYLDSQGACACAPYELPGEIHLGPASFIDEETLAATLAHEQTHVFQYAAGYVPGSGDLEAMEAAARAAEAPALARILGVKR